MKNSFCDLSEKEINKLPERFRPYLFSPFQHNVRNGLVTVPTDTFKEIVDIITEYAALHVINIPPDDHLPNVRDHRAGPGDQGKAEQAIVAGSGESTCSTALPVAEGTP